MVDSKVECTALCEKFICERKPPALKIKNQGGKKIVWCNWIDEECDQGWCVHSKCAIRKMSQDGKCTKTSIPAQTQTQIKFDDSYPDTVPKEIARKFKLRQ
jgi:hypothetical protein